MSDSSHQSFRLSVKANQGRHTVFIDGQAINQTITFPWMSTCSVGEGANASRNLDNPACHAEAALPSAVRKLGSSSSSEPLSGEEAHTGEGRKGTPGEAASQPGPSEGKPPLPPGALPPPLSPTLVINSDLSHSTVEAGTPPRWGVRACAMRSALSAVCCGRAWVEGGRGGRGQREFVRWGLWQGC